MDIDRVKLIVLKFGRLKLCQYFKHCIQKHISIYWEVLYNVPPEIYTYREFEMSVYIM